MYRERNNAIKETVIVNMWCISSNQVSGFTTDVSLSFTPVLNVVPWPQSPFLQSFIWLLWSQVLNPVSTLPGPCPWNWNFLVYHRVPFQQARTQLSFNHSPRSYRCVWSKYKVSLLWFDTQGTFCLALAVHMKRFQGKDQMASQMKMNVTLE